MTSTLIFMENIMKQKIKSMKSELKGIAQEIRTLKSQRKTHVCKWAKQVTGQVPGLDSAQFKFRIEHIAYCLLRGRKPEEIENRWKPEKMHEKEWAWKQAYALVDKIKGEADETVCVSA